MLGGVVLWLVALFDEQGRLAITRFAKWMIDPPVRLGLITIGTGLIIYAFWDQLLHLFGIQSKKRFEASIRTWLDAFHLSVQRLPNPNAYFEFRVTPEQGSPFILGNYKDRDRYLWIIGGSVLSEDDRKIYDNLSQDEQNIIGSKAIMELCRVNVQYTVDLPKNKIDISKRIPITSDLDEHVLMTSIDQHANARSVFARSLMHSMLEVRKRLELPPPKQEEPDKVKQQVPPNVPKLP